MPVDVAHELMQAHCVAGSLRPGAELALRIAQTLTQDATGTTVMLELEAIEVVRAGGLITEIARRLGRDLGLA